MDTFDKDELNDTEFEKETQEVDDSAGSCFYDMSQPLILEESQSFTETEKKVADSINESATELVNEPAKETSDSSQSNSTKSISNSQDLFDTESMSDVVLNISDIPTDTKPANPEMNDIFEKDTEIEYSEITESETINTQENTALYQDTEDIIESSQSQRPISQLSESSRKRKGSNEISPSPNKLTKTDSEASDLNESNLIEKSEESNKKNVDETKTDEKIVEENPEVIVVNDSMSMDDIDIDVSKSNLTNSNTSTNNKKLDQEPENNVEHSHEIGLKKSSNDIPNIQDKIEENAEKTNHESVTDIKDKKIEEPSSAVTSSNDANVEDKSSRESDGKLNKSDKAEDSIKNTTLPQPKSLNSSLETSLVNPVKGCSTPHSDIEITSNHDSINIDSIKSENSANDLDASEKSRTSVKRRAFYIEIEYTVSNEQTKEIRHVICDDIPELTRRFYASSEVSSGLLGDVSKSLSPGSSVGSSLHNRLSSVSNASRLSTLSRFSTSSTLSSISSVASTGINRDEHFALPGLPIAKLKGERSAANYQKLTSEQINTIKTQWNNTEELLKILDYVDHTPCSYMESPDERLNAVYTDLKFNDRSNSDETLQAIKEVTTPKSTKKRAVNTNKKFNKSTSDSNQEIDKDVDNSESKPPKSAKRTKRATSTSSTGHERQGSPERNSPPPGSNFSIGQSVFARWTDRKYYSGTIEAFVKEGKWSVKFDDGNKKTLIEEFIIKDCHNLLKGHSVYAIVGKNGEYDSGIVTNINILKNTIKYEVEVDDGPKVSVTPNQLFLTEDQTKSIRETISITPPSTPKRMGIISLDNIVEGRRATRSKLRTPTSSPRPGVSGLKKKIEELKNEVVFDEVCGVEPEFRPDTPSRNSKGPGRVKGIKTDKRSARSKFKDDIDNALLGPIPQDGSQLFSGLSFIFNYAKPLVPKEPEKKPGHAESTNESGTETETESMEFTKVPFVQERLEAQVIAGGGEIYKNFEDVPPEKYSTLKLVSNRPNKTAKYLQCMAAGVMILSHEWVINCCKENERRMFQELPYGWSIEKNCFIDSFKRKSKTPLKDLLVVIAPNKDPQFIEFWKYICTLAGGTVQIMESDDYDFQTAAFVLADSECSERVVDRALTWDIPLLSFHWIVQSIIHGEARPFNGLSHYSYDFVESD